MKQPKKQKQHQTSGVSLARLTRGVYILLGFYALSIIIFDAGNLITRETVVDRATLAFVLVVLNSVAWYASSEKSIAAKNIFTYLITIALIAFAGFTTYDERGMASTSTIFYVVPLFAIATLRNRHALITTTVLTAATYAFSAVKYFNDNFNEGYRIQLWGSITLYGGVIIACAWLIMVLADLRSNSN